MCGIYGKLSYRNHVDLNESILKSNLINHRGPDYFGYWYESNIFLGHARLSIMDLTAAGNQPFGAGDSKLVFNGEIYNWMELRDRYLPDAKFSTKSDTEVLYYLLEKMGVDCLPLLNGMFAFAFYSKGSRRMIVARDRVGIKPLHYAVTTEGFEFASEVKSLDFSYDANRLKEFLFFNRFGKNTFPFQNIHQVNPGCYIEIDCHAGSWVERSFSETDSLVSESTYGSYQSQRDVQARLEGLLVKSVRMHEQSDAEVGFLCSGGLDSSLISALSTKVKDGSARLYHADFEGDGRELHYADSVARHLGVSLSTTVMTKRNFWELFPKLTYHLDVPIHHPHSVSLFAIAKKVREDGVKVLLAGDGADELFLGYSFYRDYYKSLSNYRSMMHPRTLARKSLNVLRRFIDRAQDPYWFFSDINRNFQRHAHVGFGGDTASLSDSIQVLSLVSQDGASWKRWIRATESYSWLGKNPEADLLSFQLYYMDYFLQPLLHRLDRMLMATSVEGRVPFLENNLIEFALNLPIRFKTNRNSGKLIVKRIAESYIPRDVIYRKKSGFTLPFSAYISKYPSILNDGFVCDWMNLTSNELKTWCNGNIDLLYRLISIEVWGRIFVYRQPWSDVSVDC